MKTIDILKTASGNIWQSKLRTLLTIIAIFIGAFTLTMTTGIGSGISQYIDGQVNSIGAKNVLIITAKQTSTVSTGSSDPAKYDPEKVTSQRGGGAGETMTLITGKDITKIKNNRGVLDVTPMRSAAPSYIYNGKGQKYVLSVNEYIDGTNVVMSSGAIVDNKSSVAQIALPYNYTSVLGFTSYADAVGKVVIIGISDPSGNIGDITATISGVPQKSLMNGSGAYINNALFDKLYAVQNSGVPANSLDKYRAVIAHFDATYTDAQITDLKNRLDKAGFSGQTIADTLGIVKKVLNGIITIFDVFAIIALLAASFGVINTLLMSVQERTKEIGLMKAMGMSRGRIFTLFSAEAVILGFWGSFLGVVVAMGVGNVANNIASKGFLKDFEGLHLLAFPTTNILYIMLGIMAVAFLAGTLPARRASGLNPIDALRYE